jgi:hypothetical protein
MPSQGFTQTYKRFALPGVSPKGIDGVKAAALSAAGG